MKALPIAPAGWGVGDAAFVYFWGTQGVPNALAFSLSIVYGVEQMAISLVGALCLAAEKERVSTQEVEKFAQSDEPPVAPPPAAGATGSAGPSGSPGSGGGSPVSPGPT